MQMSITGAHETARLSDDLVGSERRLNHRPGPRDYATARQVPLHQRSDVRRLPGGLHARRDPE